MYKCAIKIDRLRIHLSLKQKIVICNCGLPLGDYTINVVCRGIGLTASVRRMV